jgi:hypothetical protein
LFFAFHEENITKKKRFAYHGKTLFLRRNDALFFLGEMIISADNDSSANHFPLK